MAKRLCKCGCGTDISNKHINAKFVNCKHKDRYHNSICSDRHKDCNYYKNYNMTHPERLERIGIDTEDDGQHFMDMDYGSFILGEQGE